MFGVGATLWFGWELETIGDDLGLRSRRWWKKIGMAKNGIGLSACGGRAGPLLERNLDSLKFLGEHLPGNLPAHLPLKPLSLPSDAEGNIPTWVSVDEGIEGTLVGWAGWIENDATDRKLVAEWDEAECILCHANCVELKVGPDVSAAWLRGPVEECLFVGCVVARFAARLEHAGDWRWRRAVPIFCIFCWPIFAFDEVVLYPQNTTFFARVFPYHDAGLQGQEGEGAECRIWRRHGVESLESV